MEGGVIGRTVICTEQDQSVVVTFCAEAAEL